MARGVPSYTNSPEDYRGLPRALGALIALPIALFGRPGQTETWLAGWARRPGSHGWLAVWAPPSTPPLDSLGFPLGIPNSLGFFRIPLGYLEFFRIL